MGKTWSRNENRPRGMEAAVKNSGDAPSRFPAVGDSVRGVAAGLNRRNTEQTRGKRAVRGGTRGRSAAAGAREAFLPKLHRVREFNTLMNDLYSRRKFFHKFI